MSEEGKKSFLEQFGTLIGGLTALAVALTALIAAYNSLRGTETPAQNSAAEVRNDSAAAEAPATENASAAAADETATTGEASPGCERESELRSPSTTRVVPVTFVNASDRPVYLYWINEAGERSGISPGSAYDTLAPGEDRMIESRELHAWVLVGEDDVCRQVIIVGRTAATYTYR